MSAWGDQDSLLVIWASKNLKLSTLSTSSLFMWTGACSPLRFLKSMTISFVLLTLRKRLLLPHQFTRFSISFLYSVSTLIEIRPTMVVSSANLKIELEGNLATQSWLYQECSRGLGTQPCGAPVLRMIVEEVLLSILTDCVLWVGKFRI